MGLKSTQYSTMLTLFSSRQMLHHQSAVDVLVSHFHFSYSVVCDLLTFGHSLADFFAEFFAKHGFVTCKEMEGLTFPTLPLNSSPAHSLALHCPSSLGSKSGDGIRRCASEHTETPSAHSWFRFHDRWLRRADGPEFPGTPYGE